METRITLLYDPIFLAHQPPVVGNRPADHPELPARLRTILDRLQREGVEERYRTEAPPTAPEEALAAVHPAAHLDRLRQFTDGGGGFLDPDTYATTESLRAALRAAGAMTRGVDLVLDGSAPRAFSLARPPGHHARANQAMGFCLLNSIAVGAHHARLRGVGRILIVDWDVHHGNGTQEIFYLDPDVLYFSLHQWPHFPGTGRMSETGEGLGLGSTVNVPLPPGIGDEGYRQVFDEVLVPVARRFAPELILISAGYDAHAADPLAGMLVSSAGFASMTRTVTELADAFCGGRVVGCLEGGYHLDALADSVLATFRVLAGEGEAPPAEQVENGGNRGSDGKPGDGKPGDGKPGNGKPGNGKSADEGATDAVARVIAAAREAHHI